ENRVHGVGGDLFAHEALFLCLVLGLHLGCHVSLVVGHLLHQCGIPCAENAHGEQAGVLGTTDGDGGHGHAGGHLHDGQQGVHAVEVLQRPGDADDRQRGGGGDHAGQVGGTTGAGNDDLEAT